MKKRKLVFLLLVVVLLMMVLSACAPGNGSYTEDKPAGFFWGIWHGWIAPISLIAGIFGSNLRIYEVYNTGIGYDIGFYIAIISGFGGLSLFRGRKS